MKYYQFLSSTHTDTSYTNTATIPLSTQQVSLSTNLGGHWNIPGDMNTSSSTVDIGTFVQANAGLYTLYTNNWVGVEVIAMQINIVSSPVLTGTAFYASSISEYCVELVFLYVTFYNTIEYSVKFVKM